MRPHRRLKLATPFADHGLMSAGPQWLRRVTTCLLVVALISGIQAAASAHGGTITPARSSLLRGEAGSGPAPAGVALSTARVRSAVDWSDISPKYAWARDAIDRVAGTNDWMRDFATRSDGTTPFRPGLIETRAYFARAVVRAFGLEDTADDPAIVFPDMDRTDPFAHYANVAVQLGLMQKSADGGFSPSDAVTTTSAHRVLVAALGLLPTARQIGKLHTAGGKRFDLPPNFGSLLLGMRLGFRYNNDSDRMDVGPRSSLTRAQIAYSLARAVDVPDYTIESARDQYRRMELPKLSPSVRRIVQWGVRYVGYPYVWGGEWGLSSAPSGLGGQSVPGFDCSGLTWWLMRRNAGPWQVSPPRPYAGWRLPQRVSADMASVGKVTYDKLRPGDLMFYDGDRDGRVDHVDTFIGNGWALDSGGSAGGVSIAWVGPGSWYQDYFVHGRRLIPKG